MKSGNNFSELMVSQLETKMERLATAHGKEKRRISREQVKCSTEYLNSLVKEFAEVADAHFERSGKYSNYCYYVVK